MEHICPICNAKFNIISDNSIPSVEYVCKNFLLSHYFSKLTEYNDIVKIKCRVDCYVVIIDYLLSTTSIYKNSGFLPPNTIIINSCLDFNFSDPEAFVVKVKHIINASN